MQLDFFESSSPPSATPSSSLSPIIGLRVRLPKPCSCCGDIATIGSSAGPHAARLTCDGCHSFRGWLGARETAFICQIVSTFGCPTTPIVTLMPANCSAGHSACAHACAASRRGARGEQRCSCSTRYAACWTSTKIISASPSSTEPTSRQYDKHCAATAKAMPAGRSLPRSTSWQRKTEPWRGRRYHSPTLTVTL
jgi:hypothetical protein